MYRAIYSYKGILCGSKPIKSESFAAARSFFKFMLPKDSVIIALRKT